MRFFTGILAHTTPKLSYEGEPKTNDQKYELTTDQARAMAPGLKKLPVVLVHEDDQTEGEVIDAYVMDNGAFVCKVAIDDEKSDIGKNVCHMIDLGMYDNFSLQHDPSDMRPTHVAVCKKGARPCTFIFDGSADQQTNKAVDKQMETGSATVPQAAAVLISASKGAMSSSQAAPQQQQQAAMPAHALLANSIFQDSSHAMVAAGLSPMPGSDAANKQAQQQQFMQSMFQTYMQQQQQQQQPPQAQQQQQEPANERRNPPQAEQQQQQTNNEMAVGVPQIQQMSQAELAAQGHLALATNRIPTGAQRLAMTAAQHESIKKADALEKQLRESREENEKLKKRNNTNIEKFTTIIADMTENKERGDEYRARVARDNYNSDPDLAIQSALPVLCSANATFKARNDQMESLVKENTQLKQLVQSAFASMNNQRSLASAPPPPQQVPVQQQQPQQQLAVYQQQQPQASVAVMASPNPLQQQQPFIDANMISLIQTIQSLCTPPPLPTPLPQTTAQQYANEAMNQERSSQEVLVSAAATRRNKRGFDGAGNAGFDFKGPRLCPAAEAFYSDLGRVPLGVTDSYVASYRRSLGDNGRDDDDDDTTTTAAAPARSASSSSASSKRGHFLP